MDQRQSLNQGQSVDQRQSVDWSQNMQMRCGSESMDSDTFSDLRRIIFPSYH